MASKNVDLVLSNPWRDPDTDKVHDVGGRVSVTPELAQRLVSGGVGIPATKSGAEAAGTDVKPASVKK